MKSTVAQFATCTTLIEVQNMKDKFRQAISDAAKVRRNEITKELDKATKADCSSWNKGDVVYFGKPDRRLWIGRKVETTCVRKAIVYQYVRGSRPRVWLVVPKGTGTTRGETYGYPGKELRVYNLGEIRRYEIGRTELSIRKITQE